MATVTATVHREQNIRLITCVPIAVARCSQDSKENKVRFNPRWDILHLTLHFSHYIYSIIQLLFVLHCSWCCKAVFKPEPAKYNGWTACSSNSTIKTKVLLLLVVVWNHRASQQTRRKTSNLFSSLFSSFSLSIILKVVRYIALVLYYTRTRRQLLHTTWLWLSLSWLVRYGYIASYRTVHLASTPILTFDI